MNSKRQKVLVVALIVLVAINIVLIIRINSLETRTTMLLNALSYDTEHTMWVAAEAERLALESQKVLDEHLRKHEVDDFFNGRKPLGSNP